MVIKSNDHIKHMQIIICILYSQIINVTNISIAWLSTVNV